MSTNDKITLPQIAYDKLFEAFQKTYDQDRESMRNGMCAYRGDHGTCCAVGHLISDAAYYEGLEGNPVGGDMVRGALFTSQPELDAALSPLGGEIKRLFLNLLNDLLSAHDDAAEAELGLFQAEFKGSVISSLSEIQQQGHVEVAELLDRVKAHGGRLLA